MEYSGIFGNIREYSGILGNIREYSEDGIFGNIWEYSENGIFGIFRVWNIQRTEYSGIFENIQRRKYPEYSVDGIFRERNI